MNKNTIMLRAAGFVATVFLFASTAVAAPPHSFELTAGELVHWAVPAKRLLDLTCEYKMSPLAIDEAKPRFSWRLEGSGGALQVRRRIVVRARERVVWDSGEVPSGESVLIPYAGEKLKPRTKYDWTVTVTLDDGSAVTAASSFETGLMDEGFSRSKWIGAMSGQGTRRYSLRLSSSFTIDKPIARASLRDGTRALCPLRERAKNYRLPPDARLDAIRTARPI